MKECNWTEAQASDSVDRYEKLFKLFGKGTSIVPTKEIDDVWHLHMLDPVSYYDSCMTYHGKLIGHNPALESSEEEQSKLHSLFLATAKIWEEAYGEEYSGAAADCDGPDHSCLECSTGPERLCRTASLETIEA
tara:strand:+ start:1056 stop:1457 length:402 start_codon:yes stop_codon:yes gene_type:complete